MNQFALMKYDVNWSNSETVVSAHRSEAAADRALEKLGNVRGYYVARRKPDGEFESPLEARERCENVTLSRGGRREGSGRPSSGLTERFHGRCTPEEKAKLDRLGGSEWVREQIQRAKEPQ